MSHIQGFRSAVTRAAYFNLFIQRIAVLFQNIYKLHHLEPVQCY